MQDWRDLPEDGGTELAVSQNGWQLHPESGNQAIPGMEPRVIADLISSGLRSVPGGGKPSKDSWRSSNHRMSSWKRATWSPCEPPGHEQTD